MNPSTSTNRYTDAQRREAADWFVVIHSDEEPGTDSIQAWLHWLDQDEGNRAAFEAVAQTWHSTPSASALLMPDTGELRVDAYVGDQPVEEWLAAQPLPGELPSPREASRSVRRTQSRRWALLAAASVFAAAVGLFAVNRLQIQRAVQSDEFATRAAEQIEITLADGSHVWLGPKSTLRVAFSKERRAIELAAGEAFFSVKKDRGRPFSVRSNSGDITAVGTAFNVRAVDDHVTVAVSEGVVTVAPTSQPTVSKPMPVRVASGQQLTFTAQEPIKALAVMQTPVSGERARWRNGVLVYRDEPLRDVVKDVMRYTDRPIEIAAPEVGDMRYSGIVYKSAVDEWTSALPESFPVKIVLVGNRQIIRAR